VSAFARAALSVSAFSVGAFAFDSAPIPPAPAPTGSGGGRYYSPGKLDEDLEKLRLEAEHAEQVREAVVEAVTQNYYAPEKVAKRDALAKLSEIAAFLQFRVTKADRELLALEVMILKMEQDDDDDAIAILLQ